MHVRKHLPGGGYAIRRREAFRVCVCRCALGETFPGVAVWVRSHSEEKLLRVNKVVPSFMTVDVLNSPGAQRSTSAVSVGPEFVF